MTTLQRDLDDKSRRLSIRAPIVATPGLLKIALEIDFHLEHRNALGTGLYQFRIGQHTSAARKVLKASADQHQVIAVGGAAPSPAYTAMLTATDGVSLTSTLDMARGYHARLRVVLTTLFRPDHPTALARKEVNSEIMERETELE